MDGKTPQQIEAIEKETRSFVCPCCNANLQFRARVQIVSVGVTSTREEIAEKDGTTVKIGKREKVANEFEDVLNSAKKYGVFDAFVNTLDVIPQQKPKNPESYFITWLQNAQKQKTFQFALRQCLEETDINAGGDLELWGCQNVSAILSDGEFKMFVPKKFINGESIETLSTTATGSPIKKATDLTLWKRTRFGYIAQSREFSDELRKHSIGSFQV